MVTGYFDYVEDLIENKQSVTTQEFVESTNKFLEFRKYTILPNEEKIPKQQADEKTCVEYDAFNKTQKITSYFDEEIKKLLKKEQKVD